MATYYVDTAVGNDGNAGTSAGSGNAWATIQHAVTTAAEGDTIYVKASAPYLEAVDHSANTWLHIIGYTTTPGDGGKVTIDAENTRAYCYRLRNNAGSLPSVHIENFIFDDATGDGFDQSGNPQATGFLAENCEFINNGGNGCDVNGAGAGFPKFINCAFHDNGGYGINALWHPFCFGCSFRNNARHIVSTLSFPLCAFCTFDTSSDHAIASTNSTPVFINCTFNDAASSKDFINLTGSAGLNLVCINTAFYNGGRYAINVTTTGPTRSSQCLVRNCSHHTMTTGFVSSNLAASSAGEITADPEFVDAATGDLSLDATSPLKAAAVPQDLKVSASLTLGNFLDIGAAQREEPVGGGSRSFAAFG